MIERLIRWSIANRLLVVLCSLFLAGWGGLELTRTPVDAIPDLSDVQVIIRASYPGQAPQVVEDQLTYPLTTAMLSVPKATSVRGFSMQGDSFVYILFADGTDLYWARSRVLEALSQVKGKLPAGVEAQLGPDATGVGWVYQYALVDRSGRHDLAQLRSLQEWFLKFELRTVPGVAEVATVGGMVKQYQVVLDPDRMKGYNLPLSRVKEALMKASRESSGSVMELAEAEYMIRSSGYVTGVEQLKEVPVGKSPKGVPVFLEEVAEIRTGPQMRSGIGELDGEGEAVGGIIVMRWGENALKVIDGVKKKLETLKKGLPEGVEVVEVYDRSGLIQRAVDNLKDKLGEEFVVVSLVCALFLFHLRSALVVVLTLPLGILAAFIVMNHQGINANIMSLGGIAIAIGAMVDAAIVMIENAHRHLERHHATEGEAAVQGENRWRIIGDAAVEVGPPLFFSLLIITLSFLPVFSLEAQEGRLFAPLAFTKSYAMAAAAILSVTLAPVLMGYFIRGKMVPEDHNPVTRMLIVLYRPFITAVVRSPRKVLVIAVVLTVIGFWPVSRLGSEFMPELDEGDLLYMPTTFPGISIGKAQELIQQSDRLIKQQPEVKRVYGKAGRADTATDPSPLSMFETVIQLKPREQWRPGMTMERIKAELDALVKFPGMGNAWVYPIKTRIDMLATGIKTPLGIKIAGPQLPVIEELGGRLEELLKKVPGASSVFFERVSGGRYVVIEPDRRQAARYGLSMEQIQEFVEQALGGENVAQSVEGRERYPVNLRYPQEWRDSPDKLKELPLITEEGARVPLGEIAVIRIADGPPMVRSENARPNGWLYVDIQNRDLGSFVDEAKALVEKELKLPAGYSLGWSGQYEYMLRAKARLTVVVPLTVAIIVLLLFMNFRQAAQVLIVLGSLPLALVGGVWLLWLLDYNLSVAAGVGFIAMAGVAVEIAVVKLIYLEHALEEHRRIAQQENRPLTEEDVRQATVDGVLRRVRPVTMTVMAIIAGLLPIMLGHGTGSEVMRRIAAPMVGGMVSTTILTMVVIPALFLLWRRREVKQ